MKIWIVRAVVSAIVTTAMLVVTVDLVTAGLAVAVSESVRLATQTALLPDPSAGAFDHGDLTALDGLAVIGSARQDGPDLLLTDGDHQAGGAWSDGQVRADQSWSSTFDVTLGPGNDGVIGDGLVFVMQSASTSVGGLGGVGGSLGYSGLADSVGVELDTHTNDWDPGFEHVAIDVDGYVDTPVAVSGLPFPLTGSTVRVRVDYDADRSWMRVYLGADGQLPADPVLSTPLDLQGELGDAVARVGLVGATGSAWERAAVHDWSFDPGPGL